MERTNFFVVKKVDNITTVDTYTFYPMLSQFGETTVTLINSKVYYAKQPIAIAILIKKLRKF